MRKLLFGKYPRAAVAGAICGLAGIPLIDAVAHATGRVQGNVSLVEFAMIFVALISIILALNFLAGALSQAIAPGKPSTQAEIITIGFVAGVALLLTEVIVFSAREVAILLDQSKMPSTSTEIPFIHVIFILMMVFLIVPASIINGIIAATGSLWYNGLKSGAKSEGQ
jgi:hypothetical protein